MSGDSTHQTRISVLTGGDSAERPGSLRSGATVTRVLREAGFEQVEMIDLTQSTFSAVLRKPLDLAFIAIHGGFGENGVLQGALELMQIPYTGSGVAASAISADKSVFSQFIRGLGYHSPAHVLLTDPAQSDCPLPFPFPVVVKPVSQGCSYGLFYCETKSELREKAEFAFKFGGRVIVEEFIAGRELSVGVYHDPVSRSAQLLPIAETLLKEEPVFDFQVKALHGTKYHEMLLPSPLAPDLQRQIEAMCADIFMRLGCRGYVRFDLRLTPDGRVFFIENDTCPGMIDEDTSEIPLMLKQRGIRLADFFRLMMRDAFDAYCSRTAPLGTDRDMFECLGLNAPSAVNAA